MNSLLARLIIWIFVSLTFPLSVTATTLSFQIEVLGCTNYAALPPGSTASVEFTERVLARLEKAERQESDPWLRDDIRIAWITTLYASRGNPQPHVDATYRVLGIHPDKVWPAILARRAALLGRNFGLIGADAPPTCQSANNSVAELSPKKPCASERNPRWRKAA